MHRELPWCVCGVRWVSTGFLTLWVTAVFAQDPILVVGHKNPDTDAIISAIAAAALKSALGDPAQARSQGDANPETRFILKRFGYETPPVQATYAKNRVILVDHSDRAQAPDDLDRAHLVGLFDHHKLGDVQSAEPIEVIVMPVGSTATVLQELFAQRGVAIDPPLAGLMLGAILSDTRSFRSPTTTQRDRVAAQTLADRSEVLRMEEFGRELLLAYNEQMKTMNDETLIGLDLKVFEMGRAKVGISQIEAFDIGFLRERLTGLRKAMDDQVRRSNLQAMVLAITDIEREGSLLLVAGPRANQAGKALDISDLDGTWRSGVMSRKKQLVPPLEDSFSR